MNYPWPRVIPDEEDISTRHLGELWFISYFHIYWSN